MAVALREEPLPILLRGHLALELVLPFLCQPEGEQAVPRRVVERARVQVARLERVALQVEGVVAVGGLELDHRHAARQRAIRDRPEARVAALDGEQAIGLDGVERTIGDVQRAERVLDRVPDRAA